MSIYQKELLNKCINKLKDDLTIQKLFSKNGVDLDVLDIIPIKFEPLSVSAKTDHGIISLNEKLLDKKNFIEISQYLVHELSHFFQQCFGNVGTQNSDDGNYLENKYEQEAFQNQVEFIANNKSENAAEKYVDKLLDYHDVNDSKKDDIEDVLLAKV